MNLFAQESTEKSYTTDEVVISAGRIPATIKDIPGSCTIISSEDIKNAPADNVQDILTAVPGVDVKKRGPEAVQADISIRGGSYEQTLILLDGMKLSDPQTGHHNMNLPVNIEDIQKIEILNGQASTIYGPNALAGVINIITKKGDVHNMSANVEGGQNGYYRIGLGLQIPAEDFANTISFSRAKSDGYRHNTDFENVTSAVKSNYTFASGNAGVSFGYTDRKFGANSFYSSLYPDQWEHVKTFLLSGNAAYNIRNFKISPKFSWRQNTDHYMLNYADAFHSVNDHLTNSYNAELQSVMSSNIGFVSLTGQYGFDRVNSSNLGVHNRNNGGIAAEFISLPYCGIKTVVSGYAYRYSNQSWQFLPAVSFNFDVSNASNVYVSYGKSYRVPTFTELYYQSKIQQGNSGLRPEHAQTWEAGANYRRSSVILDANLFFRKGTDLIDWIKYTPSDIIWNAANLTEINTTGGSVGVTVTPEEILPDYLAKRFSIQYTYLNSKLTSGSFISKYLLDHLRHQLITGLTQTVSQNWSLNWLFRYEARVNQKAYFITDAKVQYKLLFLTVILSAENVFNIPYQDMSGIPLPGRWLKIGFSDNI
jgi:iron complex outermembrane receptor protein